MLALLLIAVGAPFWKNNATQLGDRIAALEVELKHSHA
jgi:hypothetical protein